MPYMGMMAILFNGANDAFNDAFEQIDKTF